jgi:hypothetical protein
VSAARMWRALIGQAGGRVLSAGTICPQSHYKIHHIYNLPIVRDLGQSPEGSYYCSHTVLTFSDILLK